jgi:hypothetical protein
MEHRSVTVHAHGDLFRCESSLPINATTTTTTIMAIMAPREICIPPPFVPEAPVTSPEPDEPGPELASPGCPAPSCPPLYSVASGNGAVVVVAMVYVVSLQWGEGLVIRGKVGMDADNWLSTRYRRLFTQCTASSQEE